jgi:2,4-dienoyl-CoA reductase-like NADH-dependent reductase (Old Yellow Enzyme family)
MSRLFSPAKLRGLELANRLVVAPMCQYSADDGSANAWHLMHLGTLANSGAGLLILEATGVEAIGRITHGCLGLYSDDNERALVPVLEACRRFGQAKLGIQLGHAGRKAASKRPWEGISMQEPVDRDGWRAVSASAIPLPNAPMNAVWPAPHALSIDEIAAIRHKFIESTLRCDRLGFDLIEIHAAHGYLLHQFLSPLSNKRTDQYGGSMENRQRFVMEIFRAMRAVWPEHKPLGVRVSAVDWVEGGLTIEDTVALSKALKAEGCDFMDISSGGNDPTARVPVSPGYQVPFAEAVKRDAGIATMAVGMITDAQQAEAVIADGKADFVMLARGFLDDPHWGWHAAYALKAEIKLPPQYARAGIRLWNPAERHQAKQPEQIGRLG